MRKSELMNTTAQFDSFDTFEDQIEGEDQAPSSGGQMLKFTNQSEWTARNGETLPPDLELIAVGIDRIVIKWTANGEKEETIVLEPGQKFPDVTAMNDAIPREQWIEGPSGRRGPWQSQHVVRLLNPQTMDRYWFPTGTVGGRIAVSDLVEKTKWMRRYRGENVFPIVACSDVFMNTRFGGRQRPHFLIKRWITLGGGALPNTPAPALTGPAAAPVEPVQKPAQTGSGHCRTGSIRWPDRRAALIARSTGGRNTVVTPYGRLAVVRTKGAAPLAPLISFNAMPAPCHASAHLRCRDLFGAQPAAVRLIRLFVPPVD
jgi:hypothetical protein